MLSGDVDGGGGVREPDTTAAWQAWDDECAAEDIRRRASSARTEDEYLEALRDAGSLAAGARIMNRDRAPQLTLTDRIVLTQCRIRESERLAAQAATPLSPELAAAAERHYQETTARLEAFRILGDGPALSREWRDAKGNYWSPETGFDHDYEAAVRAELAARSLKETA